jgi:diguanylate cyclase (GGDEF)-like protein
MWELITVTVARREPLNAAMLFVDIDRFRSVNQVFGPGTGDAVLEEVGRRLKPIARPHAVGRLGGDDFAICCIGITPAAAMLLGAQAAAIVAQPFRAHGQSLHLTASVGVAHTETAGLVDIRQGADDAMYVAKSKGGNQSVAFVRSMHDQRREQAELEEALHRALDRDDEISIAFQPVLRLADRGMAAVEALARWTHPRLGSIPPDVFIPIAETRSMIIPLGLKLMDLTIAEAARWRQRHPGKMPVVNLNISPLQFAEGDVIGDLTRLLESHRMAPESICIEVTEAAVTDAHALLALQGARRQGFMVSIDDFGVGYSSLSQLPRLPLSSIKLDRSFISHAADSVGDTAMLYAIVQLAHALGLRVIAEGVERTDQLALVEAAGCDYVQGYLLSRPLSPSDLGAWLTAGGMPSALRPAGG